MNLHSSFRLCVTTNMYNLINMLLNISLMLLALVGIILYLMCFYELLVRTRHTTEKVWS